MAFPVVEATATSEEVSATTSHTVSLPSGIVSGEKLMVWFGVEHSSDSTVGWPGGWTELDETFSTDVEGAVAWRPADGTEGTTITVTTGQSQLSGHISARISGVSSNAPEISASANSNGPNSADVPSLSPSWGAAPDTLWLASVINANAGIVIEPSNYGSLTTSPTWGTAGQNGVAQREFNAANDDPDHFSLTSSVYNVTHLVAVEPTLAPEPDNARVSAMHFQRHYEPTAVGT